MKLKLSPYGISSLIDNLEYLSDTINTAGGAIVDKLVDAGVATAIELNSSAPKSGKQDNVISGRHSKNGKGGRVIMQGENAIYDEFGTGEYGAENPHPMKSQFALNDYNSGPIVSKNINKKGRHYWFYYGYTEGIPSGKQMYNTLQYLRKEKSKIAAREMKDALAIFKK